VVDHIQYPLSHLNLPRVVQYLRLNLPQTLRALLKKGHKPSIDAEVVYALTVNPMGEEILKILVEEELASVVLTEELVCTAAHNKWNRKILEYLVRNHTHEFPMSLRTLLTVAGTSHSALQSLVNSRKGNIPFNEQDHLVLAKEKSMYTIQKLISLGLNIPITTELIKNLAASPLGSQILKLLLDTQTIAHPLTSSDVLTVAKAFNLETFGSLLRHRWADNELTEELVLAVAFNCFLDPPAMITIPDREARPDGLIHQNYRPVLRQSTMNSSTKALVSLMEKKELKIDLTKSLITLISEQFGNDVIVHLLNRVAGVHIFTLDASYDQFSLLLKKHASDLGISRTISQALNDSYKVRSTSALGTQKSIAKLKAVATSDKSGTDISLPMTVRHAALLLGLDSLPKALEGLEYSTSEYDARASIHVQPGWRVLPERKPQSRFYGDADDSLWI
jgi:hypothetical protein